MKYSRVKIEEITVLTPEEELREAIKRAYMNCPEPEACMIERIANNLIYQISLRWAGKNTKSMFGFDSALELIAKLGIFLNDRDKKLAVSSMSNAKIKV